MRVQYGVRKGTQFVSRFTYPQSTATKDLVWEESPGIQFAPCAKAILGDVPYLWWVYDSADFVARAVGGRVVSFVDDKETRGRKRAGK